MPSRRKKVNQKPGAILIGLMGAGAIVTGGLPGASRAEAAPLPSRSAAASTNPTALFALGVLTIVGDNLDNNITVSRDAAGKVLINGGAVKITGGTPTVANTRSISVLGAGGNDTLVFDEASGALPRGNLIGGAGNDTLVGGSGADNLIGQAGNDTVLGKGGQDLLFGGADSDTLTGGDADDQVFGEAGDDRMIWNPGDDTDLNEGGAGNDVVEVNGGNGAEQFTTTANGPRVRFDRIVPAPFSIDIGTSESLTLNANGGDDTFSATGNLATLIAITVDGGTGNDTLSGSNGADTLRGGQGNDFVDGQQGNDVAFLGSEDDTFQWDPGDGSDVVEGQEGNDTMVFNGSNINELFDISANGSRVRFTRNVGAVTMDIDDIEIVDLNAVGGADTFNVNDLSGTDVTAINTDLALPIGGTGDGAADSVIVNATAGDDIAVVGASGSTAQVVGLATSLSISGAEPGTDRVTLNTLAGNDVVDASGVQAGSVLISMTGDLGDDVLIGGDGDDNISGGDGDDVLIGGPGFDTLDGGPGDDVLIDGEVVTDGLVAGQEWLEAHASTVDDTTVIAFSDNVVEVPVAELVPETTIVPEATIAPEATDPS